MGIVSKQVSVQFCAKFAVFKIVRSSTENLCSSFCLKAIIAGIFHGEVAVFSAKRCDRRRSQKLLCATRFCDPI